MSSNPNNSGNSSDYTEYKDDGTIPTIGKDDNVSSYLLTKFDSNIDTIKSDLKEIKDKINFDSSMLITDISIGVISSFIVSVLFLFITTNLGQEQLIIFGLQLPVFVLFSVSVILVAIAVFFITKKIILRKNKKRKRK